MIAVCFLASWLMLASWDPYCDCFRSPLPHCYGQPNPYAPCVVRL